MQAKKIMFALLGVILTALLRSEDIESCIKYFPFIIAIVVLFWAFDAYTYYYQEKLREAMDQRFQSLKRRYPSNNLSDELTLPDRRSSKRRLVRSIFNGSVLLFYPPIIIIVVAVWLISKYGLFCACVC